VKPTPKNPAIQIKGASGPGPQVATSSSQPGNSLAQNDSNASLPEALIREIKKAIETKPPVPLSTTLLASAVVASLITLMGNFALEQFKTWQETTKARVNANIALNSELVRSQRDKYTLLRRSLVKLRIDFVLAHSMAAASGIVKVADYASLVDVMANEMADLNQARNELAGGKDKALVDQITKILDRMGPAIAQADNSLRQNRILEFQRFAAIYPSVLENEIDQAIDLADDYLNNLRL
jgi:hypothetical protein